MLCRLRSSTAADCHSLLLHFVSSYLELAKLLWPSRSAARKDHTSLGPLLFGGLYREVAPDLPNLLPDHAYEMADGRKGAGIGREKRRYHVEIRAPSADFQSRLPCSTRGPDVSFRHLSK